MICLIIILFKFYKLFVALKAGKNFPKEFVWLLQELLQLIHPLSYYTPCVGGNSPQFYLNSQITFTIPKVLSLAKEAKPEISQWLSSFLWEIFEQWQYKQKERHF